MQTVTISIEVQVPNSGKQVLTTTLTHELEATPQEVEIIREVIQQLMADPSEYRRQHSA